MSKDGRIATTGILAAFGKVSIVLNHNTHPLELDILASTAPADIAVRIAVHPRTAKRTLVKLAGSQHADVRCAVGENSNTPIDVLWKLAKDASPDVRYSLAENHNIDQRILRGLSDDENPYVASRAQRTLQRLAETVAAAVEQREPACATPHLQASPAWA